MKKKVQNLGKEPLNLCVNLNSFGLGSLLFADIVIVEIIRGATDSGGGAKTRAIMNRRLCV